MKNDLLTGKPIKSIIMFALPIMGSSLFQYSYGLVDNIIVGRFVGTDALAAVGNVGSINGFIIGTALGLTSGFTIPVAQIFGANDRKRMNSYHAVWLLADIPLLVIYLNKQQQFKKLAKGD